MGKYADLPGQAGHIVLARHFHRTLAGLLQRSSEYDLETFNETKDGEVRAYITAMKRIQKVAGQAVETMDMLIRIRESIRGASLFDMPLEEPDDMIDLTKPE